MADKLTRAQREQIIFKHIKGDDDPLYEVQQTKHGKWIVKAKPIQLEEEESIDEEPEIQPVKPIKVASQVKPTSNKQEAKRERRRRNRHAKQDAKRILDALNNLINANNEAGDESSDDTSTNVISQQQYTTQLIDANPSPVRYQRRVLRFN